MDAWRWPRDSRAELRVTQPAVAVPTTDWERQEDSGLEAAALRSVPGSPCDTLSSYMDTSHTGLQPLLQESLS